MVVPNGWGRLTSVINSNANVQYREFDALGRVTKSAQVAPGLGGSTYLFAYEYNPGGLLISETYPSGRKIQYAPTSANRVSQVNSVMNQAQTDYARQMAYAPSGAPASWNQGPAANSFTQEWKYNSRMQTTQLHASGASGTLLKLTLGYGEANNNGNLRDQTIETGVKTYRQNYSYDAANRLTNFEENILPSLLVTTRDTFQYDRFGNQWRTSILGLPPSAVGPASSSAYNAAKNQLVSGSYDAAGNQQLIGPNTAIYDAENKIVMHYLPTPDTWIEVKYDGEGKRVLRTVGGVQTRYVYDAFGDLAAEYTTGSVSGGTKYLVTDHLGSTRLVLDATGNCVQRSDYLPFGFEQWRTTGDHPCYGGNPPGPQSTTLRFTGKERDAETGLDYFGARYYSAAQGRWTSPDPYLGSMRPEIPQSFNRYAYVLNSPTNYIDPDGYDCAYLNSAGDGLGSVIESMGVHDCTKSGGYWVSGRVNSLTFDSKGRMQFGYSGTREDGTIVSEVYAGYVPPTAAFEDTWGYAFGGSLRLLWDFLSGSGATNRDYDMNSAAARNLTRSAGFGRVEADIRNACAAGQTSGRVAGAGTFEAAGNIFTDLVNSPVGGQVGGYGAVSWSAGPGDSVNVNFRNVAGANSFFYHVAPNRTGTSGPFRSINQNFNMNLSIPCGPAR